ncbi:MAG: cysteine synthase family protein, partial [Acidobacteriota bacterium]|nr:cysteine synthase family protein [Acidobacteriota bacterium]
MQIRNGSPWFVLVVWAGLATSVTLFGQATGTPTGGGRVTPTPSIPTTPTNPTTRQPSSFPTQ